MSHPADPVDVAAAEHLLGEAMLEKILAMLTPEQHLALAEEVLRVQSAR